MRPVQGMKRTRDHLNSIYIVLLGTCQLLLHTWVCGGGDELVAGGSHETWQDGDNALLTHTSSSR